MDFILALEEARTLERLMEQAGWGRYPRIKGRPVAFHDARSLARSVINTETLIAYGNGRSYGDSALARRFVPMRRADRMLAFDDETGLLTCESGVLLAEIIEAFLPRGWFLKVVPGTKRITVGGAIASDVHGKNHHAVGCFGQTVGHLLLMLPDGRVLPCSRDQNKELFLATCGGMGLTGIILQASFFLQKVRSCTIDQTTIRTRNLRETFAAYEQYAHHAYSVAWVDGLAPRASAGRSLLMVGDFADDGDLEYRAGKTVRVPVDFPDTLINRRFAAMFNTVYYARCPSTFRRRKVDVDRFFFPLDAIDDWNRIYGRKGFIQYQFVLPLRHSRAGIEKILEIVRKSGIGSFLTVLKRHGPANDHFLSFPLEGYSLALDFKVQPGLFQLLDRLDEVVLAHKGRIYLAKDARAGKEVFKKGYPRIDAFRSVRSSLGLDRKFISLQSKRLGL